MKLHRTPVSVLFLALLLAGAAPAQVLLSANGYEWDISTSDGGVSDGGDDAFDGYGQLYLRVSSAGLGVIATYDYLSSFSLTLDGRTYLAAQTPVFSGIQVSRNLYAPSDQNFLRYFDTFSNTTDGPLTISVAFGGNLGSDSRTTLARTSSGDATLTLADHWSVTIENQQLNPAGPAENDPVVGVLFGNTPVFRGFVNAHGSPLHDSVWAGNGNDGLSYRFELTLGAGQSSSLVYFLYRGRAEINTSGTSTGSYGEGPLASGQIDLAASVLTRLASEPDYTGLSVTQIGQIANFVAVPEPSTWMLLLLGAGWLGIWLRRWR